MKNTFSTYLSPFRSVFLLAFACVFLMTLAPKQLLAQYWHVGISQGISLAQRGLAGNTNQWNWMPSLAIHYFPKNNPIILGGSLSMQFFSPSEAARKQGENFELLVFPLSMCFQYLLLPEPPFRPYYGIETGAAWYRYRFFNKEREVGGDNNIALLVTPNAGVKVEIFEDLDIDLNVRYQFLFHERLEWGSAGQATQGYNILTISLGLNYQLFR
jgi:outer membrane protein W